MDGNSNLAVRSCFQEQYDTDRGKADSYYLVDFRDAPSFYTVHVKPQTVGQFSVFLHLANSRMSFIITVYTLLHTVQFSLSVAVSFCTVRLFTIIFKNNLAPVAQCFFFMKYGFEKIGFYGHSFHQKCITFSASNQCLCSPHTTKHGSNVREYPFKHF